MVADFKELWRFRELLFAMVERELRIRYKNSIVGFFWSLINPLVTVAVMTVVFQYILRNDTPNYSAYVLAAYLPFMFFNVALLDSAQSVIVSLPIVKKVYFPREILPLSAVISNFIHLMLAMGIFFVYLFGVYAFSGFHDSPFTWRIIFLPVMLVLIFCLVLGVALIVSALNVFYEDVKYLLSVGLYLMFFTTPVMYFSETVYNAMQDHDLMWVYHAYHLNPVAVLATGFKRTLLPPTQVHMGNDIIQPLPFPALSFAICAVVCIGTMILGYHIFNRMKWRFVERP
jgi:ABC-type polysaccharide/polyol phosphate export permease